MKCRIFLLVVCLGAPVFAVQVAITVDDMPFSGSAPAGSTRLGRAQQFIEALEKHRVPSTYGFINGIQLGSAPDETNILSAWIKSGNLLANHTFSHVNLNKTSLLKYERDIEKNEPILKTFMGSKNYHYFRYPYLVEGKDKAKRIGVYKFLREHGYQIAGVTILFTDWEWNRLYLRYAKRHDSLAIERLKGIYVAHLLKALKEAEAWSQARYHRQIEQILLVHMGAFQALMMDELLTQLEIHGVTFVSLSSALEDKAYSRF